MAAAKRLRAAGFTLIELMVVIAIIGLLSAVVLAALSQSKTKGQNARIQSDIHQWHTALELYYTKYGYYPLPTGGKNAWVCLGKYADGSCWKDNSQSEDTAAGGFDAQISEILPGLPTGQSVVANDGSTYEGYIYQCRTLTAGKCSEYYIYWPLNGKSMPCDNEQGTRLANFGTNASECMIDIKA